MKRKLFIAALLLATIACIWYGCASTESGPMNLRFGVLDDKLTVNRNGSMVFESGSSADFESGSSLKIAGTALTSSAAEMNYNDGVTPGTVTASKTIMAGATKNLDSLRVTYFDVTKILKGTEEITSSAAELNMIDGSTAGTAVASKALVLGSDRGANYITVSDSLLGEGTALFSGFIKNIDAGDGNSIAVLTTDSGKLFVSRLLPDKRTFTLPSAAAGLIYDFFVADADSILITTATGDSLITSAGSAYKTTSSVAGTVKVVAIDATRWLMLYTLGTWTSY